MAVTRANARTKRLRRATVVDLAQGRRTPYVSEAVRVSTATAHSYFPRQAALVHVVAGEARGPILSWPLHSADAEERVVEPFDFSKPRTLELETMCKIALKLSRVQRVRAVGGTGGRACVYPRQPRGASLGRYRSADIQAVNVQAQASQPGFLARLKVGSGSCHEGSLQAGSKRHVERREFGCTHAF